MDIRLTAGMAGLVLLIAAAPAFGWRCAQGFVDAGDSAQTVRKKCGAPAFVFGSSGKSATTLWYYDSGPQQLVRVLAFYGNVLANIDTAGYGLRATAQPCTPADIRAGMQVYALFKRCGKPRNRRTLNLRTAKRSRTHVEIWTYDFGRQYLLQKVTLADGRVQGVETAERRPH